MIEIQRGIDKALNPKRLNFFIENTSSLQTSHRFDYQINQLQNNILFQEPYVNV